MKILSILTVLFSIACVTSAESSEVSTIKCSYEYSSKCKFDVTDINRFKKDFLTDSDEKISLILEFNNNDDNVNSRGYWGTDKYVKLKHFLRNIKVVWGGREVEVPVSAYSGLSSISSVQIYNIGGGFHILVYGGDASTSYTATLAFVDKRIVWRKVVGNSFPEIVWETSVYSSF